MNAPISSTSSPSQFFVALYVNFMPKALLASFARATWYQVEAELIWRSMALKLNYHSFYQY